MGWKLQKLHRNKKGSVATEFALLAIPLILLTFGIIEFGFLMYQWNAAEKATQWGVRLASVGDPVASDLKDFSGLTGFNTYGDSCRDPGTGAIQGFCRYDPDPIICTVNGCSGYGFSADAFAAIVDRMRSVFPLIQAQNVVVEYRSSGLGFVGRPGTSTGQFNLVPMVTVRVQGLSFKFMVLEALIGLGTVTMPTSSATLTGEVLSNEAV